VSWGAVNVAAPRSAPLDAKRLDRFLGEVLWADDRKAFRVKGAVFVAAAGVVSLVLVQGVYDAFDVTPFGDHDATVDESRLAFIGAGLDADALERGFRACVPGT